MHDERHDSDTHPLLRAARAIGDLLRDVADLDPTYVPTADKAELLIELQHDLDRLQGTFLAVVEAADDVPEQDSSRNVASWLAARTRTSPRTTGGAERLAGSLGRWERLGAGIRSGGVTVDQARVAVAALDRLADAAHHPDSTIDADLLAKAEGYLVEQCALHSPAALSKLGRRLLEVIAPDVVDEEEHRRLLAEERRAEAATSMVFTRRGDGATDIRLRVPDASAARLLTYLDAYTAPRRTALEAGAVDEATGKRIPASRLRGEAFCHLLEHLDPDTLPRHGGRATTLVVTVELDQLMRELGTAGLASVGSEDGSATITAGQARRLACTAGIVPAVLGKGSAPLDLGRTARLFSPHQQLAMALRDRTCRAEHCTMPAAWCEAHHFARPWSKGGLTDIADGKLLCSWHHHRAHDDRYLHSELPNGDVRFRRRT